MILVLTAGFGDGHNTAAASTAAALRQLCPDEEIVVTDLISEVHPSISAILKSLYQIAITHLPSSWRFVYWLLGKSELHPTNNALLKPLLLALRKLLETQKPRAVVSTYPLYAGLMDALQKQMPVPKLITIITDSTSVHRIWIAQPSDLYCVADMETDAVLQQMGIPADRTRVCGFPVSLQFTEKLPELENEPDVQRILYLPSTPSGHVRDTLQALRPLLVAGSRLTIPVGKHASRLFHVLRELTDSLPADSVHVIGWTSRIPELLRTHDVVICKAGGAILHEVMAAQIPAVIDYVVPGQEEGNADYLISRRCALRSHTGAQTSEVVAMILADNGKLGRQMKTNLLPISLPDAAMRTAHEVLTLISQS